MMTLRNPPNPGHAPRQDHRGDLDQIGKNEDFIEQVPFELLEVGHHILPDRERFDLCLPSPDSSATKSDPRWQSEYENSMLSSVSGGFSFWLRAAWSGGRRDGGNP